MLRVTRVIKGKYATGSAAATFKVWEISRAKYLDKLPRTYEEHVTSRAQVRRARIAGTVGQGV
jgi:hypothetical protein